LPYTVDRKILGLYIFAVVVGVPGVIFFLSETVPACPLNCSPAEKIPGENIVVDSVYVNSSTIVTLTITNTGTVRCTLASYFVNDSASHQYASTGWSGPTLAPNAVTKIGLPIDGRAFSFQTGKIYNIIMVSATNKQYQFTFTV
jgi:hypothetical protein